MRGMVLLLKHFCYGCLFLSVVFCDRVEEHPAEAAELAETVHLVEDGYGVDHAPFCFFARREVIVFPVVYEDEAAAVLEFVSYGNRDGYKIFGNPGYTR
jgi:hypothetical protein